MLLRLNKNILLYEHMAVYYSAIILIYTLLRIAVLYDMFSCTCRVPFLIDNYFSLMTLNF